MKRSSLYPGYKTKRVRFCDQDENMNPTDLSYLTSPTIRAKNNFVPVSDYENYLEDMENHDKKRYRNSPRLLKESNKNIERIRQKHIDYYKNKVVDQEMTETKENVFVFNRDSVTKNGVYPFRVLEERYNKYGKSIPINERIKALKALNAPREYMIRQIINHDKNEKWKKEAGELLDIVFEKYGNNKSKTKPKKKSIFSKVIKTLDTLSLSDDED